MTSEDFVIDFILRLNPTSLRFFRVMVPQSIGHLGLPILQQLGSAITSENIRRVLKTLSPETLEKLRQWIELPETLRFFDLY